MDVVGVDALRREHVRADHFHQRHQSCGCRADPIGERRDVEIDAFAGVDCALAVERQMQAVLREQDVRQELRPGAATRDRVRRRRRLGDRLARAARELLAHMLDHLPLPRDHLQRLGHVLAQLVQSAAAARAGRGRRIDHALARQVIRQRPARRLAPLERLHLYLRGCRRSGRQLRLGFRLRGILRHVGKLKLELLEHGAAFEDCPNRSCRSWAIVNFICSISSSRARTSASALRALTSASTHLVSAASHAMCVAITIALSVATSSGRESGVGGTQQLQHRSQTLRAQIAR